MKLSFLIFLFLLSTLLTAQREHLMLDSKYLSRHINVELIDLSGGAPDQPVIYFTDG
ncbi:hypothetical protein [Neolewinella persica]|uniref:hypothetical protein n=1 Tax=Neolewinella persica TaxID=70998 RepID=UPI000366CFA5|nr:hypothetical protein [Neolewinella persica]